MGFIERDNKIFAKITADGIVRIPTSETDPEAVTREVELSDGAKKTYHELEKKGIQGKIESIEFKETDYGKMLNITFALEEGQRNQIVLGLSAGNNFATSFMERLPNLDLSREISLSPWAMEKNGKSTKGMVVWQTPKDAEEGTAKVKVPSFFKTPYVEGTRSKLLNNYPAPEGDGKGFDKDDWKMYFTTVKKFLIKFTEENIIPTIGAGFDTSSAKPGSLDDVETKEEDKGAENEDGVKVEDVPM